MAETNDTKLRSEQNVTDDYSEYLPLLFSALGRLANKGYVAPPSEALELINDFFVECWQGVLDRFDSSLGRFSTYLFAAFVQYARPRIVESVRWRQRFVPIDELPISAFDRTRANNLVSESPEMTSHDILLVREAFQDLASRDRVILEKRVVERRSEREIAESLGISRYAVRQACAESLAQLAVAIDERRDISLGDWSIARCLWYDGLDIDQTAATLQITATQVKLARIRVLEALTAGLERNEPLQTRRKSMTTNDLCSIWNDLVTHPKDSAIVNRAKEYMHELLDHVEDCATCTAATHTDRDAQISNLSEVYLALGVIELPVTEEERTTMEELLQARASDEAGVQRAVKEALLPALPERLRDIQRLGEKVSNLTLFLAMDAFALLIRRFVRHNKVQSKKVVMRTTGDVFLDASVVIPAATVVQEIANVVRVDTDTALRFQKWIFSAARCHPKLLIGVDSAPLGITDIELEVTARHPDEDLFLRWNPDALMVRIESDATASYQSQQFAKDY